MGAEMMRGRGVSRRQHPSDFMPTDVTRTAEVRTLVQATVMVVVVVVMIWQFDGTSGQNQKR